MRGRFILGLAAAGYVLLCSHGQRPGGPSAGGDPPLVAKIKVPEDLEALNRATRQLYAGGRARELAAVPAVILVSGDDLILRANGRRVVVAGVVLMRQRPGTANGITFVTLEDEAGIVNLIVRRDVWEQYRRVARTAVGLIAHGRLQRERLVTHVLVSRLEDLSEGLSDLAGRSRDFH